MKTEKELKAELVELKKTHKMVYSVTAFIDKHDDTKTATLFLKDVDRVQRESISAANRKLGGIGAVEVALRNLRIGGDELNTVVGNDYATLSAEDGVLEILEVKGAILKKN